jgi:hypothetical protein
MDGNEEAYKVQLTRELEVLEAAFSCGARVKVDVISPIPAVLPILSIH